MSRPIVLITGAAGFTGVHLVEQAMDLGFHCVALVQSKTTVNLACDVVEADLLDPQSLELALSKYRIDYVIHLAAISFVAHGNVNDIYGTNISGTVNLLEALVKTKQNVKKVLAASTGNVYGSAASMPIDETSKLSPVNDYAVSKLAMESAIAIRSHNFPIVVTRPFNYTGIGQNPKFLIPKIVDAFRAKQPVIELGNTDISRDFSDVRDISSAYLKLIVEPNANGFFNVCSGKAISLRDIIELCEAIAGYKIDIVVNPDFVRANEIKELYGDDLKLRSSIGTYRQYSIQETLKWMYNR